MGTPRWGRREANVAYVIVAYLRSAMSGAKTMAILFRSSENEKQRARLCGGRIHVLGPSTDSDEPLHHEGSPPPYERVQPRGAMGRSYTSSGALVPWCTHREESTRSWNPANEGASLYLLQSARITIGCADVLGRLTYSGSLLMAKITAHPATEASSS